MVAESEGFSGDTIVSIDEYIFRFDKGPSLKVRGADNLTTVSPGGFEYPKHPRDVKIDDTVKDLPTGQTRQVTSRDILTKKFSELWTSPGTDSYMFHEFKVVGVVRTLKVPLYNPHTNINVIEMRKVSGYMRRLNLGSGTKILANKSQRFMVEARSMMGLWYDTGDSSIETKWTPAEDIQPGDAFPTIDDSYETVRTIDEDVYGDIFVIKTDVNLAVYVNGVATAGNYF